MDGKTGAEELVGQIMRDPDLLKTLTSKPKEEAATAAAPAN
jgi:type VI secretion system protein ImpB